MTELVPAKDELDQQIAAMLAAGMSDDDVMRLTMLRFEIAAGRCHEDTLEQRRAVFARYLAIQAGRRLDG
jgi:hypothetical protein